MLKNRSIPFGYCVINGRNAINETETAAVREIFEKYIGGKSLKTIAAEMTIPYNTGKAVWNINMVCRVLENRKYIGENGYPKIVAVEDFERVARIKLERTTYRKPAPQNEPQQIKTAVMEYESTDEIQRITNEINRLLDSEDPDKERAETLIINCAQLKYLTIREVKT